MSNVIRLEYAYGVCPKCRCRDYLRYLIHKDGLIHKPYEIKCVNCNSYFTKEDILGNGEETTLKPITNYGRLISKTPEEMAEIIASDCPPNYPHINCREYEKYDGNLDCCKCWLDWLKATADKEKA